MFLAYGSGDNRWSRPIRFRGIYALFSIGSIYLCWRLCLAYSSETWSSTVGDGIRHCFRRPAYLRLDPVVAKVIEPAFCVDHYVRPQFWAHDERVGTSG
jgi:hypothetical protein